MLPLHENGGGGGTTEQVFSTVRQGTSSKAPMSQMDVPLLLPSLGRVVPRSSVGGHVPAGPLAASVAGLVGVRACVMRDADASVLPWRTPPFGARSPRPTLMSLVLDWSPLERKMQLVPVSRLLPSLTIVPAQLLPLRASSVFFSSVTALVAVSLYTPPPPPRAALSAI